MTNGLSIFHHCIHFSCCSTVLFYTRLLLHASNMVFLFQIYLVAVRDWDVKELEPLHGGFSGLCLADLTHQQHSRLTKTVWRVNFLLSLIIGPSLVTFRCCQGRGRGTPTQVSHTLLPLVFSQFPQECIDSSHHYVAQQMCWRRSCQWISGKQLQSQQMLSLLSHYTLDLLQLIGLIQSRNDRVTVTQSVDKSLNAKRFNAADT